MFKRADALHLGQFAMTPSSHRVRSESQRVFTWRISPPARRGEAACCSRKVGVGKRGFLAGNWAGRGKPSPWDSSQVHLDLCNTALRVVVTLKERRGEKRYQQWQHHQVVLFQRLRSAHSGRFSQCSSEQRQRATFLVPKKKPRLATFTS